MTQRFKREWLSDPLPFGTYVKEEDYDNLAAKLISGFYEERVPQFRQGEPRHELEELVTAEEVTRYVAMIEKLNRLGDTLAHELAHDDNPSLLDAWWKARGGHDACSVCNPELGEPTAG